MASLDLEITHADCIDDDADSCELEPLRTRYTYFECFPTAVRLDNTDNTGFLELHFTYRKIEVENINRQSAADQPSQVARIDGMPKDCESSLDDIAESLDITRVIKLTRSHFQ